MQLNRESHSFGEKIVFIKKAALENWEILKKRKNARGMEFRDLIFFNRAMLGKQAWKIQESPIVLWSQIFNGIISLRGASVKQKNVLDLIGDGRVY